MSTRVRFVRDPEPSLFECSPQPRRNRIPIEAAHLTVAARSPTPSGGRAEPDHRARNALRALSRPGDKTVDNRSALRAVAVDPCGPFPRVGAMHTSRRRLEFVGTPASPGTVHAVLRPGWTPRTVRSMSSRRPRTDRLLYCVASPSRRRQSATGVVGASRLLHDPFTAIWLAGHRRRSAVQVRDHHVASPHSRRSHARSTSVSYPQLTPQPHRGDARHAPPRRWPGPREHEHRRPRRAPTHHRPS